MKSIYLQRNQIFTFKIQNEKITDHVSGYSRKCMLIRNVSYIFYSALAKSWFTARDNTFHSKSLTIHSSPICCSNCTYKAQSHRAQITCRVHHSGQNSGTSISLVWSVLWLALRHPLCTLCTQYLTTQFTTTFRDPMSILSYLQLSKRLNSM